MNAPQTRTASHALGDARATREFLLASADSIKQALPERVSIDRFLRVCNLAVQQSPGLRDCTRESFFKACVEAATDGLIPDGRQGVILPYRDKKRNVTLAQWQPMVWGIVDLVKNSREVIDINAYLVREGETFRMWVDEKGPHFTHEQDVANDAAPIVSVYAFARTRDGGVYVESIGKTEMKMFRAMARSGDGGPWEKWAGEMFKVRVIKRLCKRLPMSPEAAETLLRMDRREGEEEIDVTPRRPNPVAALNARLTASAEPEMADDAAIDVTTTGSTQGDDDAKG